MSLLVSKTASGENFDDILMAMDVVDTLRHSSRIVERELNTSAHDAELLSRLRGIYQAQGIAVPDHILREGVSALREDRFTYHPTPPSFSRQVAECYVKNQKLAPFLVFSSSLLLLIILSLAFIFLFGVII